jgi:hypothetical protein
MTNIMHVGDFGLFRDRTTPVATGVGAKLKTLTRRVTDALDARHRTVGRPGDCPSSGAVWRTSH